jgi:hypothetical protein
VSKLLKCFVILSDLSLLDVSMSTNIYNDNCRAVDWSNTCSTKGMQDVSIREHAVFEACLLSKVSIHHAPGSTHPADLFIKEFISDAIFEHFVVYCNVLRSSLGWGVVNS